MKLTHEQMVAFDHLMAAAFTRIRSISYAKHIDQEERNKHIHLIADAFHNIPWRIGQEDVDVESVLSDLSIVGGSLYERGKEILSP